MRVLTILGLLAIVLLGAAVIAYEFARPGIPLQRLLTDRQGKEHDVTIVGKENGVLVVEAKPASDSSEIPIHSLILADRLFAHWLADQPAPQITELPVDRTITNSEGKSLEVRIIGREKDFITVERISDNARFDIPVSRLLEPDRRFIDRIRKTKAPKEPEPPAPVEADYVATRRAMIEDLESKADLYRKEIKSRTLSKNIHEKRIRDLQEIRTEIRSLEVAIENYKFINKDP